MNESEKLLQALNIQAAAINDLTNAIHHLAEQVTESNRVMLATLAGDEEIDTDDLTTYLDGSRRATT